MNFYSNWQREKERRQREDFKKQKQKQFKEDFPKTIWEFFKHLRLVKKKIKPSTWNFILKIRIDYIKRIRKNKHLTQLQKSKIREIYKEEQNKDLRDLNYFSEKDYKIYESKLSDYDKQILVDCF